MGRGDVYLNSGSPLFPLNNTNLLTPDFAVGDTSLALFPAFGGGRPSLPVGCSTDRHRVTLKKCVRVTLRRFEKVSIKVWKIVDREQGRSRT